MRVKPTLVLGRPDEPSDNFTTILRRSLNFWIVVAYLLLYVTAYYYYSVYFNRDPTSFFFGPRRGYRKTYSLQREKRAKAFIETKNRSTTTPGARTDPLICLGLATVARSGEQYVRKTIGSSLEACRKNSETLYALPSSSLILTLNSIPYTMSHG